MNDKEVQADGGGTDRRRYGVQDGCIQWPSVEEEEELRREQRRNGPGMGAEEDKHAARERQGHAPEREQIKSAVIGAQPALRQPAANQGAGDAIDDRDGADHLARVAHRKPGGTAQELRNPSRDATHGKGQHCKAESGCQIGRVGEQSAEGGAIQGGLDVVARASLGLAADPSVERGDDQAGNCADEEWRAPAPEAAQYPARQVAEGRADGNGEGKDGEDAIAVALGIEVGQHSGGEDAEGRLAYAYERMADVEGPVVMNPRRAQRGQAPQDRAADNERLSAETISQPAGGGRSEHVKEQQRRGQRAHLLVGGVELPLNERYLAGQDVAVDVVEQVEADQQQQGPQGGADALAAGLGQGGQEG